MATILGVLLNAESPATTAVFTTLRTGRAQRDAIWAAAEHILDDRMKELFEAILLVVRTTERTRADIAHGHWGILRDHENVVTWISSKDHAIHNARALNGAWPREGHAFLLDKTFVYTLDDFEETYEQIEFTWRLLFDFLTLHRSETTKSGLSGLAGDELYSHLINEPRVQEARTRLDRRQNRKR
ncbi:hypothetical protein J7481_02650 [Labrenzia sp. R4_2]|uniref:hypothetical protein n=1 Tax=Labrenzia sp. R4_2 TaxID=2821107 RepID=UPI001ADB7A37|nr:hypothetical protein [Labrenzia sp. R4_2]MBO9418380.1 hypothetical protein [Labrenzia sp. R4_2]